MSAYYNPSKVYKAQHVLQITSKDAQCCAGVNQYDSDRPARYVSNTNLSSRVASLNPPWNGDQSEEASNAQFQKAMQLTGHEFMEALEYYSKVSHLAVVQLSPDCCNMLHTHGRFMCRHAFLRLSCCNSMALTMQQCTCSRTSIDQ